MKTLSCNLMHRIHERLSRLYGEERAPRLLERLNLVARRYAENSFALPASCPQTSWDQSDVLMITYGDMVRKEGEAPLVTLKRFADEYLKGAINIIHLLPIYPYSSDEGFSVIDYRKVNPDLGDWEDVDAFSQDYSLMLDLVLNHCSRHSQWFQDFVNGIAPARDFFVTASPEDDLSAVVRPRTHPLLTRTQTRHGERYLWTTFSEDQIDLDFSNPDVLFEFLDILLFYASHGARIVRLDAVAFLWKRIGTSCLHLPETHEVVKLMRDVLELVAPNVLLLTETNVPHEENISYFGQGDEAHLVYQFSLPPLLLHALHTGNTRYLHDWAANMDPPPEGCTFLNFTASHDGIGVRPLEGIIPDEELAALIEAVEARGGYVSKRTGPDGSERPYELNITYFDALSDPGKAPGKEHLDRFLCSQTVPMALRGIPSVYFHCLTATPNDHAGVERTGAPRSINRHRWDEAELMSLMKDENSTTHQVFTEYLRRLRLRIQQPAFHPDGKQWVMDLPDGLFGVERTAPDGSQTIFAVANLSSSEQEFGLMAAEDEKVMDLLSGKEMKGKETLAPYQVVWATVLRESGNGP
jgi:sucrose phosphorylase